MAALNVSSLKSIYEIQHYNYIVITGGVFFLVNSLEEVVVRIIASLKNISLLYTK